MTNFGWNALGFNRRHVIVCSWFSILSLASASVFVLLHFKTVFKNVRISWLLRAQTIPVLKKEKCKGRELHRFKFLMVTESAPNFSATKVKKKCWFVQTRLLHGIRKEQQIPSERRRISSFPSAMKRAHFRFERLGRGSCWISQDGLTYNFLIFISKTFQREGTSTFFRLDMSEGWG